MERLRRPLNDTVVRLKASLRLLIFLTITFVFAVQASGQSLPNSFTVEGRLYDTNGVPLSSTTVKLRLEVVNESDTTCILYRETTPVLDLSSANASAEGVFSVPLGSGTPDAAVYPGIQALPTMAQVFSTAATTLNGVTAANAPCTVTPAAGQHRLVRITVSGDSGVTWDNPLSPDTRVTPVPSAMIADSANSLQGKSATEFILSNTNAPIVLSQANLENIFSTTKYAALTTLLNGTSTLYMAGTPQANVDFNGKKITGVAAPTLGTDAVNKTYADTKLGGSILDVSGVGSGVGNGRTLLWDSTLQKWYTSAVAGSVTSLVAGSGLLGGTITSVGTLSVDVGTAANKILQLDSSARLPAVDGSQLSNLTVAVRTVAGRTGDVVLIASDIGGLGSAATKNYGVAANNLVELNGSAQLPSVDAFLLSNVNAVKLQGYNVSNVAPTNGQVLAWNAVATKWEASVAAVTGVTSLFGDVVAVGPGLTNAIIQPNTITSAKINNAGNTANQLLITDSISGSSVTYANACGFNEVLKWTVSGWLCAPDLGTVSAVVAGSGLLGGTITSGGTLTVDTGITANKILSLNSGAQIPAVDGNLVSNVNAVKLQSYDVAVTAPTVGTVLGWNVIAVHWEPTVAATGSVQTVTSGVGLVPHTFTQNGTINVDVGVGANKIVQLTSGSQLPVVDGNLVSNVNAVKLQTRDVASTAPVNGQFLGWNLVSDKWEPMTDAGGSVTAVVGGIGFVPNTVTGYGTLNIDVGNSANKIMQLTSGGQIPGVDGYLVTNLNVVTLQNRPIATNSPTATQVLAWNGSFWMPTAATPPSQWTTTSSDIFYTAGNVSIGTTTRNQLLTVEGAISVREDVAPSGTANYGKIYVKSTDSRLYFKDDSGVEFDLANTNGGTAANVAAADGTVGSPSISFSGDTDTGWWRAGTDTMAASTGATERVRIDQLGNVGIATATPRTTLDVNGTLVGKAGVTNASINIDFLTGNSQYTTLNCQGFNLHNLKDGGNYLFAVKGTGVGTCAFTGYSDYGVTSLTVHMPPDNGQTSSGTHTLFTLAVIGADVYVSWTPGY